MNQPTKNEEAVTKDSVPAMETGEDLSFEQLFEESLKDGKIQIGEVARGRVIQITSDFVVVDVGFKSEGQIPVNEFMDYEHKLSVKEGDFQSACWQHLNDAMLVVVVVTLWIWRTTSPANIKQKYTAQPHRWNRDIIAIIGE